MPSAYQIPCRSGRCTVAPNRVWETESSPLAKYGGGGISGRPLRALVCEWILRLRYAGFTKPINGGGGILSPEDAEHYRQAGASSIFLGSVAVLRPWRVRGIIRRANELRWSDDGRDDG